MAKSIKLASDAGNIPVTVPQFGELLPTGDPTSFKIAHPSDTEFYKEVDKKRLLAIPPPPDPKNLILTLADVLGEGGANRIKAINDAKQIVFHSGGDTGPVRGPEHIDSVVDKMVGDFSGEQVGGVPSFFYHLGDVVYSFGESQYYYDQFYEPFRDYPCPVLAIAGNHDGLVYRTDTELPLDAFKRNFLSPELVITPEAGGLRRTAMQQPGIYFAFDAPYIHLIGLFSNVLEDPGVISSEGDKSSSVSDEQLGFLIAQLKRVSGSGQAVIVALHHPPYTAGKTHSASPKMLADLDQCCKEANFWPHAFFSGHAHSYQRYTRTVGVMDIPYLVCGNSGHGLTSIRSKSAGPLRTPLDLGDGLTFENYDDSNYGYLRVVADTQKLLVEYHDSDPTQKSPSDAVTVDLKSHTITYN
jgi:hypothetical protein